MRRLGNATPARMLLSWGSLVSTSGTEWRRRSARQLQATKNGLHFQKTWVPKCGRMPPEQTLPLVPFDRKSRKSRFLRQLGRCSLTQADINLLYQQKSASAQRKIANQIDDRSNRDDARLMVDVLISASWAF
jgi:hypothetical protein